MLALLNLIEDSHTPKNQPEFKNLPRFNYYESGNDEDPFPYSYSIDDIDIDQRDTMEIGIETMIQQSQNNVLTLVETKELFDLV